MFSIYMTLTYLGIGIGQQLLNVGDIQGQTLFIIAGVIFALCLVRCRPPGASTPACPKPSPTISYPFSAGHRWVCLGAWPPD